MSENNFYKKVDKESGKGLAITEWNNLSSAVAGYSGLTLAINAEDKVGIGTESTDLDAKLTVNGDVNVINGKVGIGTTSPLDEKLEVDGNVKATDFIGTGLQLNNLRVGATGLNMASKEGAKVGIGTESTDLDAKLTVNGDVNIQNGKVGIGTTSTPEEKLEVDGKVKATHFIGDGSQITNLSVGATGLNMATEAGAVGIGTTDVTTNAKLKVMGGNIALEGNRSIVIGGDNSNEPAETPEAQLVLDGRHDEGYNLKTKLLIRGMENDNYDVKAISVVDENNKELFYIKSKPALYGQTYFRGNVGIGTTTPGEKLDVNGALRLRNVEHDDELHCKMYCDYLSGWGLNIQRFVINMNRRNLPGTASTPNDNINPSISWTGGSNSWQFSSDRRLKTNIAHEQGILPRLMQLDVKNYHWKGSPDNNEPKTIGFIAQEVEPLFPSLVGKMTDPDTKETTLTLKYSNFGVLAMGAIKELKQEYDQQLQKQEQEINSLRSAHEDLQGELRILRKQMERLLAEA